jgi:hypothetical protein
MGSNNGTFMGLAKTGENHLLGGEATDETDTRTRTVIVWGQECHDGTSQG